MQGILDMIEYRNEIVIWLTEQRNYRGGWISTQVSNDLDVRVGQSKADGPRSSG